MEQIFRIKNSVFRMKSDYYSLGGFKIGMNRYEFYGNINTYKRNQENKENELIHYGTLGQKWGVRKWQNYDGTFNEAGKERYFGKGSKNSSGDDEKIGGYAADHFHKNIYLKTDKNTLKKIKKYPDIYDTEGLTDDEILKAIRRVPKIPNARAYGREIREELYNTKLNKTRSKYYETNTKDIPEAEDVEEQKIGESPEEYQAKMKKLNSLAKEFDLPTGNFEITNGVGVIKRANKDFYDDEAIDIISKNSKLINKMMNALDKKDSDTYMELRNKNFKNDMEKDICEAFINDARVYKELEKVKKETAKELKDIQKPIKKDMDFEIHYDDKVGVYDMKKDRDNIIKDNKAKERMQDFVDNYEKYIDKIADKVADYWTEDGKITIWSDDKPMSKNDFIKRFKNHYEEKLINSGNVSEDGSIYLDFNDDGMFGYHGILAIIEPDGSLHDNTGSLEG